VARLVADMVVVHSYRYRHRYGLGCNVPQQSPREFTRAVLDTRRSRAAAT
jgi:hypothetical protein